MYVKYGDISDKATLASLEQLKNVELQRSNIMLNSTGSIG